MNNKILEAIIKKEMLINIGINRNKSCIWIKKTSIKEANIKRLIETRVVFEYEAKVSALIILCGLIETRVVFEFKWKRSW